MTYSPVPAPEHKIAAAIYSKATGRVRRFLIVSSDILSPNVEPDADWIEARDFMAAGGSSGQAYVDGGVLVSCGEAPSPEHRFDFTTKRWIDPRPLIEHKRALLRRVRVERDQRLDAPLSWGGSLFDADASAQGELFHLFIEARETPGAFPQAWRLADNTWRQLSVADAQQIWFALRLRKRRYFVAFAAHETAITALPDIAATTAYDTSTGWPS